MEVEGCRLKIQMKNEVYGIDDGELKGTYDRDTKTFSPVDEDGIVDEDAAVIWENSMLQ